MHQQRRYCAFLSLALLAACGGGSGSKSPPLTQTFDLQSGVANLLKTGTTANVALSGTVVTNGVSTAFSGTGTLTYAAGVTATFNGSTATAQNQSIAGTVTAGGQTANYNSAVSDYYSTSSAAFLGEVAANEYDVASAPIAYPSVLTTASSGILGTVNRYTDSTMSVPLGTAQISYKVTLIPVDPGSPIGLDLTTKIYDTQNALVETDVMSYTLSSSGLLSFAGASVQSTSGTLTVKPQ